MQCARCGLANGEGVWQCAQCGSALQPPGQPYAGPPYMGPPPGKPFPLALVLGLALGIPAAVCVLGMMAAIAIPSFTRYVKRSKTVEATSNIAAIYQAEIAYYNRTSERGNGQFLAVDPTPAELPSASRYPASTSPWLSNGNWVALGFSIPTPHYYQYRVTTSNGGQTFTVTAVGDLDGDGRHSFFSRSATAFNGEIQGTPIEITNELE